ncbi:hypothetical protein GCM10007094_40630 [Pseudovibrio japonicus]|uniref:Uncharacterized protein n=1 Tax=Pseudovibrio japonicus TaxID=366534 RepID=A0ABQ3ERI4_9HYPH|nr:hypothetical protein GCM10007094_40630 [Pseudovibrio japonicus]
MLTAGKAPRTLPFARVRHSPDFQHLAITWNDLLPNGFSGLSHACVALEVDLLMLDSALEQLDEKIVMPGSSEVRPIIRTC